MIHPIFTRLLRAIAFPAAIAFLTAAAQATSYPSDGGLAARIQPFVDNHVIPGAVMLVANKDKILDVETVGYSDLDKKIPISANDLFMICSMTKTITAVGLMMLVDEGKVNLDDPVEKYLPAFKGQMVVDKNDPTHPHPPKHPITVREVMSHTAGLHSGHRKENSTTVAADAGEIGKLPLDWEPGSKYQYSEGPLVGGAIIEAVSGMRFADFIKQRILDPLGMKDGTFWPTPEQAARMAVCAKENPETKKLENVHLNDPIINDPAKYAPVPRRLMMQCNMGMVANYKNHTTRPDGGMFSTAFDMSKFGQMLLNGGTSEGRQYITPASLKEIATVQTKNLFPDPLQGYGLGVFVQKAPAADGRSQGSFGHHGARKTMLWVDPSNGLVLVFMTQTWDLKGDTQKALYSTFLKSAIEKYGKAVNPPTNAS